MVYSKWLNIYPEKLQAWLLTTWKLLEDNLTISFLFKEITYLFSVFLQSKGFFL